MARQLPITELAHKTTNGELTISCRNRHCPKCQSSAARDWLAARQADLLPVEYFHVVFTVPQRIAAIAYQNKTVAYDILFAAAVETLTTIAADPKHLGAEIGLTAVLHTWGQTLTWRTFLGCKAMDLLPTAFFPPRTRPLAPLPPLVLEKA